jgi:hypothetical protein
MRNLLLAACAMTLVAACAQQAPVVTNSAQIFAGMTAGEVQQILGAPQNRQFSGREEAWQYCETDYTGMAGDQYVLIWLSEGRVTGLERYTNTLLGTCETYFKQVRFENAPDLTVEVRNR